MTDKKTEALKLALECLDGVWRGKYNGNAEEAITAIREALTDRTEQQRIDYRAECWPESPHYKPAPVAEPPASKPLTDEEILRIVPGLYDCLCDPYDCDNSGDYYASIPKDMIRLARAIETAHGIKEKNT